MKKPNFFIVGEPKSGTTALYEYLKQHPEIYMSEEKEPNYFCRDFFEESLRYYGKNLFFHLTSENEYLALFQDSRNAKIIGEGSTGYLYSTVAAEKIQSFNPRAKIIMMFREPVDFLRSLHAQYLNDHIEDEHDFLKALQLEGERTKMHNIPQNVRFPSLLFYTERIKYAEHVKRFLKYFDKHQIHVLTFERFKKDNKNSILKVLDFLEVTTDFEPQLKKINVHKVIRSHLFYSIVQNPRIKMFFFKRLEVRRYYKIKKMANTDLGLRASDHVIHIHIRGYIACF